MPYMGLACPTRAFPSIPLPGEYPFARFDQIEYVDAQLTHHIVGSLERKGPLSVEDIVHVRLGNSDQPGQSALGNFAVAYSFSKEGYKSLLEVP